MSETPNSPANWGGVAVVVLAAFTAFVQAYSALNGSDAKQNEQIAKLSDRLAGIERVLCTSDDAVRQRACHMAGIAS